MFSAIKAILSASYHPCLFPALPAVNDRVWSITFLHKWNTLKQRVVPVKAMWFRTPTKPRQTRRCYWSPSPWLTFGIALHQTPPLSLKRQQLAARAKRRGYFERARGANGARKERMGREETWASHRGLGRTAERGRARRSGIIRSLCGPLKRLRRKPTDGPSAPRHLRKGDTHTHSHTPEGCCSKSRQTSDSRHVRIWKKERWTDRKNETSFFP